MQDVRLQSQQQESRWLWQGTEKGFQEESQEIMAKKVWNTPNPKKKSDKLTPAQKAEAKARAKKAGRPYPNLVDNMAVSKKGKK